MPNEPTAVYARSNIALNPSHISNDVLLHHDGSEKAHLPKLLIPCIVPPFLAFRLLPQPYSQNSLPCDVGYCPVDLFYPFSIHMKRHSRSALLQALEVLDYEKREGVRPR